MTDTEATANRYCTPIPLPGQRRRRANERSRKNARIGPDLASADQSKDAFP